MSLYVKVVDGQIDWSTLNSEYHDDLVEVPEGDRDCLIVNQEGKIELSSALVLEKTNRNKIELFKAQKLNEYESFVDSLVGADSREYVLAQSCYALLLVVKSLQQHLVVLDSDLSAEGQQAKAILNALEQDVFIPIRNKKQEILTAIAKYDPNGS